MGGGGGITDFLLPAAAVAAPFALGPLLGTAAAAGGASGATGALGAMSGATGALGAMPAVGAAPGLFGGTGAGMGAMFSGAAPGLSGAALGSVGPGATAGLFGAGGAGLPTLGAANLAAQNAFSGLAPHSTWGQGLGGAAGLGADSPFAVSNIRPGPMGLMDRLSGAMGDMDPMEMAQRVMEQEQQKQQDANAQLQAAAPMGAEVGPTSIAASNVGQLAGNQPQPAYQAPATTGAFQGGMGDFMDLSQWGQMDPMQLQMLMGKGAGVPQYYVGEGY